MATQSNSNAEARDVDQRLPHPPAAQIVSFDTEKVLYDFDETVTFRLVARSFYPPTIRAEEQTRPPFTVEIWDEHGLEAPRKVAELKLEDAGKLDGKTELRLTWKPGKAEYGHVARAQVFDKHDRLLAEASTQFDICHDWTKVMRPACTIGYKLAGEHITEADMRAQIATLRKANINTVELFAWLPKDNRLNPTEPTWKCIYYQQPERPAMSAGNIRLLARLLHENGMKLVAYHETSVLDPTLLPGGEDAEGYRVYWKEGDQPPILVAPYLKERGGFSPNILKVAPLVASQLAESVKQFGWDAIFCDSGTQACFATANGTDKEGKRLSELTAGEVGERYLRAMREAVRPVKPDFRIIFQNVGASFILRHHHWKEPNEKLEAVIGGYVRQHCAAMFDDVDCWSAEINPQHKPPEHYPQTYDKYAIPLNIVRDVTRKPVLLFPYAASEWKGEYSPAYARPFLSTLAAVGASWSDYFADYGGWWGAWADAPINRTQLQIHRFTARYGRYLRDLDLRWVRNAGERFRVESSPKLYWQDTVYERVSADGSKETVFHLFNHDTMRLRAPKTDPPAVFPVTVTRKNPGDPLEAFALDAEDESLRALPLSPATVDGATELALPPVRSWMVIVTREQSR
jgi:hypothetical protein